MADFESAGTLAQEFVFRNFNPFPYTRGDLSHGAISKIEPVFLPETLSALISLCSRVLLGLWYGQGQREWFGIANGLLVNGELVARCDPLELERYPRVEGRGEPAKEKEQKGAQGGPAKGTCPPTMPV